MGFIVFFTSEKIYYIGRPIENKFIAAFSVNSSVYLNQYGIYEIQPFANITFQGSETPQVDKELVIFKYLTKKPYTKGKILELSINNDKDLIFPGVSRFTIQELHTSIKSLPEKLIQGFKKSISIWVFF